MPVAHRGAQGKQGHMVLVPCPCELVGAAGVARLRLGSGDAGPMALHPIGSQARCGAGMGSVSKRSRIQGDYGFAHRPGEPLGAPVGKLSQQGGLHGGSTQLFLYEAVCGDPLPTPWHIQHPLGRRALLQHHGSAPGQCHMDLGLAVAGEGAAWQRCREQGTACSAALTPSGSPCLPQPAPAPAR